MKIRVGFTLFSDASWTGGVNYFQNLFSALSENSSSIIEPILFITPETDKLVVDQLAGTLGKESIIVRTKERAFWQRVKNFFWKTLFQIDLESLKYFQNARIDVVFQNDSWYGYRFPLPTIVWIADFQHKHLKTMFNSYRRIKRDIAYFVLCYSASKIMLSSEDAANDCRFFFPISKGKTSVVPFAVDVNHFGIECDAFSVFNKYKLPIKYFYFPAQLWRHKNHLNLLKAILLLKNRGVEVIVVASGNPSDRRNPNHPSEVVKFISSYGLENEFRFLGMIPYENILKLLRNSAGMINPSFFEGWSTTVEEAKALGVPLILSDLNVHKEQVSEPCYFFDPNDINSIASVLAKAWGELGAGPRNNTIEFDAVLKYRDKRREFSKKFQDLVLMVVGSKKAKH